MTASILFAILWLIWAAAFFTIEGIAVFNKQDDDTLSAKLRDLFHTRTALGKTIWIICLAVFAGLLGAHILGVLTWWP